MNAPEGYRAYHVSIPVIITEAPAEGVGARESFDKPTKLLHIHVNATSPEHAAHILWERIDAALSDP